VLNEHSDKPAFVSSCRAADETAILTVFVDSDKALLLELESKTIVGVSTFSILRERPGGDLETEGGVASRERVARLAVALQRQTFRLLRSPTPRSLLEVLGDGDCASTGH